MEPQLEQPLDPKDVEPAAGTAAEPEPEGASPPASDGEPVAAGDQGTPDDTVALGNATDESAATDETLAHEGGSAPDEGAVAEDAATAEGVVETTDESATDGASAADAGTPAGDVATTERGVVDVPADDDAAAAPESTIAEEATIASPGSEPELPALPAAPTTVAELVAATLRAAGVRLAFTVPGESFLPVLDALAAVGIRVVGTRHEGAAAFAAEAYGQLTGRPAVCLGTRAVGAANMAIGIHTATADSTPMFVLVGDVDRRFRGREAFQETDLAGSIGRLAKWAGEIDDPATAAATLEAAVRATVEGRPGPALLALPEDVLELPLPAGTIVPVVRPHPEAPSLDDVRAVLHFLAGARRPLILAGAGVLRARCSNDLVRLAELLHVPVVASWRRGDLMPNEHPLYLGMAGYGSPSVVHERIEAADGLLVLGSRLNEITTTGYRVPAPGQRWMHVDVAPLTTARGESPVPERAIQADARAFLRAAVARLRDAVLVAEPLAERDHHNAADRAAWEASGAVEATPWDGPGVHPGRIIADLRRLLPEDAILTTDAGAFSGWAARGLRFRRPGTFLGPTSGAMGYGFPAALAAALVHRERRVVALVGDGGMAMTLAELETAVREDAHVVAIVFDNEQYGMIHAHQIAQGSPQAPGTTLGPLDFAAAARACGARGVHIDTDAAFEGALRTALAASGPTLIQLAVDRRWVSVDQPATS